MNEMYVNFQKETGLVKPVHGVCCAPYGVNMGDNQSHIKNRFKEANIPYCRLHDCCGGWGKAHFVDVPNIFPDFDADENDPESYDFHYTDEYIGAIQDAGAEAYYRLGVTIEWGSKKYAANPPKDFGKWARICEHIILHYNHGWADGFEYGIKYWEIWNEPENPGNRFGGCMWTGTKEEFFELYKITSKYLSKKFDDIKIGGYGSCGFYAVTRENMPQTHKDFVTYFTDFLEMVKENNCPLDFYSWHIYTDDEQEVLSHAKYVRETLDKYGFTKTEAHLNEWNFGAEGKSFADKHNMTGASFDAAVLCLLQNTNYVDMANYYCFSLEAQYNGFMDQNDYSMSLAWYPFVAFGNLYTLGNAVEVKCEADGVYATAAKNEDKYDILAVNYKNSESRTAIHIDGCEGSKTVWVFYIKDDCPMQEAFSFSCFNKTDLTISLPEKTVVFIKIR
ncbi:MAG: hypothetical protein PUF72_12180 [Clostridiales bacterium]|nr:hypothetical protein [Clostridiales bacterium]